MAAKDDKARQRFYNAHPRSHSKSNLSAPLNSNSVTATQSNTKLASKLYKDDAAHFTSANTTLSLTLGFAAVSTDSLLDSPLAHLDPIASQAQTNPSLLTTRQPTSSTSRATCTGLDLEDQVNDAHNPMLCRRDLPSSTSMDPDFPDSPFDLLADESSHATVHANGNSASDDDGSSPQHSSEDSTDNTSNGSAGGGSDGGSSPAPKNALAHAKLHAHLSRLSKTDRLIIMLHYSERLTSAEIAMVLEMPEADVSVALKRLKRDAKSALRGDGPMNMDDVLA